MSAKRKILATNALPYANGSLHLGHLVGTIQGDIWVRLQKMQGHDCLYICGSDSHGTPIMIHAEKLGITPEALIQQVGQQQATDFADFLVEFDNYHTTHSPENQALVNTIYERHRARGNIRQHTIKQFFDPIKQMFLPDRYIKGTCPRCGAEDQYGDSCEACGATYAPTELKNPFSTLSGAAPIEKESEHYFFKLQLFEEFLKNWTRQGHLQPEVSNKLDEWFKAGLKEWDISRDAPYFGFPIPDAPNKYFYVWLDAPVGYMASFKNLCERRPDLNFDDYFKTDNQTELYHFIGKDIIYFHALFWPAILHGANYRTPTAIFANGFLTVDGQKMSKSRGTFIKARTYLDHLAPEYLRYYFAAKLSERIEDLDIQFDDFMQRVNADLVGKYINIASRSAGFLTRYFDGKLSPTLADPLLYAEFASRGNLIADKWNNMEYSQAVRQIMALADRANQYIDEKKPWALQKNPEHQQEVQAICTMAINLFKLLTIYLKPVLPQTASRVETFLNIPPLQWADKDHPLLDHPIQEYKPLIQRIEPQQIEAMKMSTEQQTEENKPVSQPPASTPTITIDQFEKIDLRIAKILEADSVEGADKLLRLKVDLGGETRQIFAGIKAAYEPASLLGKHVIVIANLAPRKMRFGVSEGMVLAAGPGGKEIWLVSPDTGATEGMKVK